MSPRKMMLSGLLILGVSCTVFGKPAAENQDNDYAMQSDDDYQYDDENVSQHSRIPMDVLKSTVAPHVAVSEYIKYVQPGESAVLECPVSDLSVNNVIMWRNGTILLTQGLREIHDRVSLDSNYTLTIRNVNEMDARTYTCQILPQNLEVHAKLMVTNEPQNEKQDATPTPPEPSSGHRESLAILACLLPSLLTVLLSTNSVQRI